MNQTSESATLHFPVLTLDTAPNAVRPALEKVNNRFGFVPNLVAAMANVPSVAFGYLSADQAFSQTSFSPLEKQVILITTSVENDCGYCTAAHSTVAKNVLSADAADIDAIRSRSPLADPRLDALVNLTREIVNQRGHISAEALDAFLAAGFSREQVPEILLGVVQKVISNYFTHLSPLDIDSAFQAEAIA